MMKRVIYSMIVVFVVFVAAMIFRLNNSAFVIIYTYCIRYFMRYLITLFNHFNRCL